MKLLLWSEWTKLRTTRQPLWLGLLVLAVTVGYAVLLGIWKSGSGTDGQPVYLDNWMALGGIVGGQGLPGVGLAVFMIVGALSVAQEYRTGMIQLTYAATPRRIPVLAAKGLVYGLACAAYSFVLTVVAEYSLKWSTGVDGSRIGFGGNANPLWVVPAVMFLAVVFAVGLGALVRNSAAVAVLILVWAGGAENLALFAGDNTGAVIRKLLPFANEQNAVTDGIGALAWSSPWLSILVFAAWAAGMGLLGAATLAARDV